MAVRLGPTHRRRLVRVACVFALTQLAPKIVFAQTGDRLWGDAFAAPAVFSESVAIPTTFVPFSLTPQTFLVHHHRETVLHWGIGLEC